MTSPVVPNVAGREPFDPEMRAEDLERILQTPPFRDIDASVFPAGMSLEQVLRTDARLRRCRHGEIIVREGDYGNSAFSVLSGSVHVVLPPGLPGSMLGRRAPQRKNWLQALSQLWGNRREPEARDPGIYTQTFADAHQRQGNGEVRVSIDDVAAVLEHHETIELGSGEMFGEIAALARTPRTTTVLSSGETELVELRWQGLREIRKRADEFRQYIDRLYRERSLRVHLRETPLFKHLDEEALTRVVEDTLVETYGNFDWYAPYKAIVERSSDSLLKSEPVIAEEGHYVDGLILIRNGFARLTEQIGHGHRTVSYLRSGDTFGFAELVHNWRGAEQAPLQYTLRAIGYVDVLRLPTATVERHVLPTLPEHQRPAPLQPKSARRSAWESQQQRAPRIATPLLEFLVENRFINGTAAMVIDNDRCTRCDDCVRACAAAHDDNPRFVRHGRQHGRFTVANACMHCTDPVCMIGCPTGAIHRDAVGGQVVINDVTCIGCGTCANSCPYHNIRLVEIRDEGGDDIVSESTHQPVLKATKCDLCVDQIGGPACERACPHDALMRIDIGDSDTVARWLNR